MRRLPQAGSQGLARGEHFDGPGNAMRLHVFGATSRVPRVRGVEPIAFRIDFEPQHGAALGPPQIDFLLGNQAPDRVELLGVQAEQFSGGGRQVRVGQKEFRRHRLQQPGRPRRRGHVHGALRRHDQRRILLPPGLGGLGEIIQNGRILEIPPRLVDDHQLEPPQVGRGLDGKPQPLEQVEQGGFAEVGVFARPRQVDHLPVAARQIVRAVGRVVEESGPCAVPAPSAHRWPHAFRHRVRQCREGSPPGRLGVEVFDAGADLTGIVSGEFLPADPHQAADPSGQERIGPLSGRQRKRPQPKCPGAVAVGGQFQVVAADKPRQLPVAAAEIEDNHARGIAQGLNQQEIQGEALAGSRGAQDQRMPDIGPAEQVVVVGGPPPRLQRGQARSLQVRGPADATGRAEQRGQAGRRAGRHEHAPQLPAPGLARHPGPPGGELAVAFADHLGIVLREDPPDIAIQAPGRLQPAVQRDRQADLAVGDAVGFQFDQSLCQPVRLGSGRRIFHRGRRAFGFLNVRRHRVAF